MLRSASLRPLVVLLALVAGLAARPVASQPQGEVTQVDGQTVYIELADSISVDAGTVGRVVDDRVVDGDRVRLTFAVLSVQEVDRPVTAPWVATAQITRQSRNLEPGDLVAFDTVIPRARLVVRTDPAGATVSVDGTTVGKTPLTGAISRGAHEVQLSQPGYRSVTHTVLVEEGETQRIRDTLQTAIGTLSVSSLPKGATVRVNDESVGTTPFSKQLQAGTYPLLVRRDGYLSYRDTVTIRGGTERQVNVPLRRPLRAAVASQQAQEVTNVAVGREGDRLVVSYDLVADGEAYSVDLLLSTNGGKTFEPLPETTAGAIGGGVAPGTDKQIVWAATEDFPKGLTGSDNRLRLAVEPDGGNGLYWVVGSVLTAGAGTAVATLLGIFGGGSGGNGGGEGDLPGAPPPAPN
jgi:hypothetical protein